MRPMRIALTCLALAAVAGSFAYRDLIAAALAANPAADRVASANRGAGIWTTTCAGCHGAHGEGDGPVAANLAKKPKDLTRIAKPPVFPDGVIAYRIANGGVVMPAWRGVLSDTDIWDLVNFIRSQAR